MLAAIENFNEIIWLLIKTAIVLVSALASHYILFWFLRRFANKSGSLTIKSVARQFYKPARWIIIVILIRILLPISGLSGNVLEFIQHIFGLVLIGLICWLIVSSTEVLRDYIIERFKVDVKDNLRARKIHTQLNVLRRIVVVTVIIVGLATMLMTFEKVRQLGTTILASAGIVGIVVGLAAQKTIGTFIAGLQIAFTQPIRIDDVVIVENEWGRIEEITLTYVVVKIWDLRRLVVPITYFIEKPFQSWTRVSAELLGSVFLYVDYTVSVDTLRKELERICKDSEYWDNKVCVLQVTNTTERTVELRALASAVDAPTAWNLRCQIREKLISFIRSKHPDVLPRFRAEFDQPKIGIDSSRNMPPFKND